MKPSVYLKTTIISYLTARPSRDLILAAQQQRTLDWWDRRRSDFELFISEFVIEEAGRGGAEASSKCLNVTQYAFTS